MGGPVSSDFLEVCMETGFELNRDSLERVHKALDGGS
jgi:hypothetical protein